MKGPPPLTTEQVEINRMMDYEQWKGHSLQVKRRDTRHGDSWELGFIINDGRAIVYKVDFEDVKSHLGRPFASLPQQRYGSISGIVRDGWRVK